MRGFCENEDEMRACALRFMAGKRKVSPPGHKRRKRADKARRQLLANIPPALASAVVEVCKSPMAAQCASNPKAVNGLVGAVLKVCRYDPAVVRLLIERALEVKS